MVAGSTRLGFTRRNRRSVAGSGFLTTGSVRPGRGLTVRSGAPFDGEALFQSNSVPCVPGGGIGLMGGSLKCWARVWTEERKASGPWAVVCGAR